MESIPSTVKSTVCKSVRIQKSRQAINRSLALLLLTTFVVLLAALATLEGRTGFFPLAIIIPTRIVNVATFIWSIFHFVNTVISHLELLAEPNDSPE